MMMTDAQMKRILDAAAAVCGASPNRKHRKSRVAWDLIDELRAALVAVNWEPPPFATVKPKKLLKEGAEP